MSVAELQRAREMLANSHHADRVVLPPAIADSWERCASGLPLFELGEAPIVDSNPRSRWDEQMVQSSIKPVSWLVERFDELIGGVVIADSTGRLLRVVYSGHDGQRALESIRICPGALFGEDAVGTNGIGTPIVARQAMHVTGEQHLRYSYQPYTCAGAPLFDPTTNQLLGMVGIIAWGEQIKQAGGLMKISLADAIHGIRRELAAHPEGGTDKSRQGMTTTAAWIAPVSKAPSSTVSPIWRRAQRDLDTSLGRGENVLVIGEASTGRATATVESYRRSWPGATWTIVHPDEIERRLRNRHAPVKVSRNSRQLIIIRDIHHLSPRAVTALSRTLAAHDSEIQIAATCNPNEMGQASASALLPIFTHTSEVPPLRQHLSDLPGIATQMLRKITSSCPKHLDAEALMILSHYSWPGNLEQLTDVLTRAAESSSGTTVSAKDLASYIVDDSTLPLMERTERDAILSAFYRANRNKSHAATTLGISRSTLYRKLITYGFDQL